MARFKRVWLRPYVDDFLRFVLTHFDVAIWTSNIRENALALLDTLLSKAEQSKLKFIWSREQCDIGYNYSSTKPLQFVWNCFSYTPENTLILDDSPEKIIGFPSCYVQVSEFTPDKISNDIELLRIIHHLESTLYKQL